MSYTQMIEEQQYSLSAQYDRFDGFDRGDTGAEPYESGSDVIGRRTVNGYRVEIIRYWQERGTQFEECFVVSVSGKHSDSFTYSDRAEAIDYGRKLVRACAH
jgi:hypothetical protein